MNGKNKLSVGYICVIWRFVVFVAAAYPFNPSAVPVTAQSNSLCALYMIANPGSTAYQNLITSASGSMELREEIQKAKSLY